MKKKALISTLLVVFAFLVMFAFGLLAGCQDDANGETETGQQNNVTNNATNQVPDQDGGPSATPIRVGMIKGPSAMGMAMLLDDPRYDFALEASPDAIVPLIVQGKLDIAALPPNLAAVLYQRTDQAVEVFAVTTLGMLYIVENGDGIHSVEELKGKTIYASGKGGPPEYALRSILTANGIDPEKELMIEFKAEHAEVVAALVANNTAVGLLPQPFVVSALSQSQGLRIALDLNQVWEESHEDGSRLIMGVTIVRKDFLSSREQELKDFMNAYQESVAFVNADPAAASEIIGFHDIIDAGVAVEAIPFSNIVFIEGQEMKAMLSAYLNTLYAQNPEIVGGAMPDDGFYLVD